MVEVRKVESVKHQNLVRELINIFESECGYRIDTADLKEWEKKPEVVVNSRGVGDGKDKQPDIDAFDEKKRIYIRGEAKTGEGDIDTPRSITQYLLFSNRVNTENNQHSLLYVIVPAKKKKELNDAIVDSVPKENWRNIKMISSREYEY